MPPATRSLKRSQPVTEALDQKPHKRPRVSKTKDHALSTLEKHPKLWLFDGNIVLAAGGICYKVHRSQLARFCAVFEDMFDAPGTAGVGDEVIEDCIVVRMPDDAADMTNFLEAMYNGHSFDFRTGYAHNFAAVAGVLRLATKYDCAALRTRLVTALCEQYPKTAQPYTFRVYPNPTPHVNVLLIARECDLPDILPSCFYQLAFAGDGVEPVGELSSNDQQRLKNGKAAILRRVKKFAGQGPPPVFASCSNASKPPQAQRRRTNRLAANKCATFLDEYWGKEVNPGKKISDALTKDPLREISILAYVRARCKSKGTGEESAVELCAACTGGFQQYMNAEMQGIWAKVSEYFKL